jgi:hypothetical protein
MSMGLFGSILGGVALFIAGVLCLPTNATAKSETLKRLLETVAPYRSWFGIILTVWGLWGVLGSVFGLRLLGLAPLWWLTNAASSILCVGAGFFLGYDTVQKRFLLNASKETKQRVQDAHRWLAERQGSVSILSLGVSVWVILYSVLFFGRVHF